MKFDFLTDYMIPPGGYHAIELTVAWQFDSSLGGVVHWSTLNKSVEGVIYPYHYDLIRGFEGLSEYIECLSYRSFDASIVKNMHYIDIRVNSTSIWIKYSDEGGSVDLDRAIIGGACSAMRSYDLKNREPKKDDTERYIYFDSRSPFFISGDIVKNVRTIEIFEKNLNEQLAMQHRLTLNHVLGVFGLSPTSRGAYCGWNYDRTRTKNIDFHILSKRTDRLELLFEVDYALYNSVYNSERRKSMPVHTDSMAALCYSDMLYSINVFNLKIKNVIFSDPATIVFWSDGSKTVVKCGERDIFDPEKGLAMAISKKFLGNKGNYNNEFKKWLPEESKEYNERKSELAKAFAQLRESITEGFEKAGSEVEKIVRGS